MKILITGGCGFLGANLVMESFRRGHDIVVFDNLSRSGAKANLEWMSALGKFQFIVGDIRNDKIVEQMVQLHKPDAIFHLAGQVAMTSSLINPRVDMETNILGTFNLLEAVRQHCPDAVIIYSSTNKVYGDLDQYHYIEDVTRYRIKDYPEGFDEMTPLSFQSPYGCSKGAADQYMLDFSRMYGLKTVVFRHSSMYGGRQFSTFDQGWVGWFCERAILTKRGRLTEPFTISGNGKQVRDVLHADDMKRLYFAALENIERSAGQAFNIGGGMANSLSLLELFSVLEDICQVPLNYDYLPPRRSDQKVFVADLKKAEKLLGWTPSVGYCDGIRAMVDWVGKNLDQGSNIC